MNYTVYHLHSYYSLLDSCTSPSDYVKRAVELGQTALAFTEHGNIYNWYEKMRLCEENGIKYLHGVECYVTATHDVKIRDNMHVVLIAKNTEGFKELNRLVFTSNRPDHTYYKHRISLDEFNAISNNVIKISACIQSPIWKMRNTDEYYKEYSEALSHFDYYEIQYHDFEDQKIYNQMLYDLSKCNGIPLIVGTDTHSLNAYKGECRVILQYGKTDGAWGDAENECDLAYKSYDEVVQAFERQGALPMDVVLEALQNTNAMADSVEPYVLDKHNKYPYLYGDDDEKVMWNVLRKNYQDKLQAGVIDDNPAYWQNINEEMDVFKKVDMIGFMLFMSELMTYARENHIATGSARGSVAGSTVAFISNITDVDPVRWHTIFSRFCNEHRVEIGDIDTDWYEDDRQKIYDYIVDRFGTSKTGYVLALGTLAEKSVIDTIGKAMSLQYAQAKGLKYDDVKRLDDNPYNLNRIAEIKQEFDSDQDKAKAKYSDLFYYYDGLCGCVCSQSQHPAGIIASPIDLIDFCGAFIGDNGQQILPLDMDCCHDVGLVKYDILGLKTVGVIDKTCKLLGRHYPRVHEINFDDQAVYDDMSNDHTTIFQFESDFAGDCLKKMQCRSVFDLSLVNACIRPSGVTYRDKLLNRECNHNPSEIIDKLLENNYGWLVYQEDTIAFLQQICGFSGSDADNIRRFIAKKKADKLAEAMPKILDGYCSKSDKPRAIAEEEAKQFLEIIDASSAYQFGYNHSAAYSIMSYLCGYFRYYHPVEYCTSFLNCAKNDDDITNGTALVNRLGIKMAGIKFGRSRAEYNCDSERRVIYKGLASIKNMNAQVAEELFTLGQQHFDNFVDLLFALKQTSIDSRQLDILIKLDFFSDFGESANLLRINELFQVIAKTKMTQYRKVDIAARAIPEALVVNHSLGETPSAYKYTPEAYRQLLIEFADGLGLRTPLKQKLRWQLELLGYVDYTDESLDGRIILVSDLDTKYSPRFKAICLKSGQSCEMRVASKGNPRDGKTTFNKVPFENGDILWMEKCTKKPKQRKTENGWETTDGFNWWIDNYHKVVNL